MKKPRQIEYKFSGPVTVQDIANTMDHSLLQPQMNKDDIKEGCEMAIKYNCISVCVRPSDIEYAAELLKDTDVIVTTVIAFPHGTATTESKVFETEDAIARGADEIDMVINIGRVKSHDWDYVEKDIRAVAEAAHRGGCQLKVILENAYLTDDEKIKACEVCDKAGADFTKTSTGYAPSGCKLEDLKLMRAHTPARMQVKAAGGIRTLDDCLAIMGAGACRIGTRSTAKILAEAEERAAKGDLVIPE
jgi:deoxyribose-phosphate aldolase